MADKIKQLQDQVEVLRRRMEQRPVLASSKSVPGYKYVLIDGGNTLETGQDGVIYVEPPGVEEVPSAYDPNATSTFIDGIGRGTLYINGVAQSGYVLVVCDDRGSFRNCLVESDVVWVGDAVSIPVDGGGTVSAYPVG